MEGEKMLGVDFSKYPRIQELLSETEMEDKKQYIKWIGMSREEAAVLIAEIHQMCKAGLSNNIPLRKRSKNASNFYYGAVGNGLHIFAREQARVELGFTTQSVNDLFSHRSILGGLHNESYVEIPLEDSTDY